MSTLAPPAQRLLRRRLTLGLLEVDPGQELGAGGEAVVYAVTGELVAKLYHQPTLERARKLSLMLANPPRMPPGTAIAWPVDLLMNPGAGFAGFLMPRAEGPRVFEFYNPVSRRETAPGFHPGLLHRAGRNLAAAFAALHAAGYVVGDVNESNFLVSPGDASVTLVDADSLQVADGASGALFRSRVGKAEFTPPELQGVSFGDVDRAWQHDAFGLAVVIYLLLMEGTHPFAARMDAAEEASPIQERIRAGRFPHASPNDDCHPPRLSPRFDALDPELQALFVRAFGDGHAAPLARPTAGEWCDALEQAEARLVACAANPLHRHAPHLEACPWCERTRLLGGRDPFPQDAAARPRRRPMPPRVSLGQRRGPAPSPVAAVAGVRTPGVSASIPFIAASRNAGVFGPAGLRNPLVSLVPALLVAGNSTGVVQLVAGVVAMWAATLLAIRRGRNIDVFTVLLVVALTAVAGVVMSISSAASPRAAPTQVDPAGVGRVVKAIQEEPQQPPGTRASEFDLPELIALRADQAPFLPPLEPAEPARVDDEQPTFEAAELDRLPDLGDQRAPAATLARLYARVADHSGSVEYAVVRLRVGRDGRVTWPDGVQVLSASTPPAEQAARALAPYLRYQPGVRGGQPVTAYVVQPLVFPP